MRKSKSDKLAEKRIERAYYARCSGIEIDIMDIGKVFAVGRTALAAENLDDEALAERIYCYVQSVRKN